MTLNLAGGQPGKTGTPVVLLGRTVPLRVINHFVQVSTRFFSSPHANGFATSFLALFFGSFLDPFLGSFLGPFLGLVFCFSARSLPLFAQEHRQGREVVVQNILQNFESSN